MSVNPVARNVLVAAVIVVSAALVAGAVVLFFAPRSPIPGVSPVAEQPVPRWAPPAAAPVAVESPGRGIAGLVDPDWVAEVAAVTGIPDRALAAYAGAALAKAQSMPECGLSWNTLAGIGSTESDHGRHGGSSVGPDGTVSPPIFGVPLDGGDTERITDSDGGEIDGDTEFDRAVGPFQLIPQTWRNWHIDASGDGVEDPHNIDDAALATANYLCRVASGAGVTLDTEDGWRIAVAGFNSPAWYLDSVARAAVSYAEASEGR